MSIIEPIEGMLVENLKGPEWGPGKIVKIDAQYLYVIFRDRGEREAKKYPRDTSFLRKAAQQADAILDNLPPPSQEGESWVLPRKRLTLKHAIKFFKDRFPGAFSDPEYIGDRYHGERTYKWLAHEQFVRELGAGQVAELLGTNQIEEIARRIRSVASKVNLLSPFESAALHDGLKEASAVRTFSEALIALLEAKEVTEEFFSPYIEAVSSLPAKKGKARVATWPVTTILPFLAQPDRHMFLKPEVTLNAAGQLGFDLQYNSTPNWTTYRALLRMGQTYKDLLRELEPQDFIDVQSFIYVACGGYEAEEANA